jgi:hypothetical protein
MQKSKAKPMPLRVDANATNRSGVCPASRSSQLLPSSLQSKKTEESPILFSRPPAMNDPKIPVSMHLGTTKIGPQRRRKHSNLVDGPAQGTSEESQGHGLCPPVEVLRYPFSKLFIFAVFGPCVDWPFVRRGDDVYEACVSHHVGDASDFVQGETHLSCCVMHVVVPSNEC